MKKSLLCLMLFLLASQNSKACSPYLAPLVSHTLTDTTINFQVISTSQWQCCFVFEMELICNQSNFSGVANLQPNIIVCKGSGTGSSSSWGSEPYPVYSFPISSLCPGITYKYRVRDRHTGYTYWSEWSVVGEFTIPGDAPIFEMELSAQPLIICAPNCATLNVTHSDGCNPPMIIWNQGLGGNVEQVVCPTVNTIYQVTAAFDVPFCPNVVLTESVEIIADVPAVAGALGAAPSVLCLGGSTNVTVTGYTGTLQWQVSTDAAGPFVDIPNQTSNSYFFQSSAVGDFYFRVVASTTCTTQESTPYLIRVYDYPQVGFNAPDICYTDPMLFENTTQNVFPVTAWLWNFGNGNTSTVQSPTQNYTPGTYQVTLTATNLGGCSNSVTNSFVVYNAPIVSFTANPLEGLEPLVVDFVNTSTGAANYTWNFGDGNVTFSNATELSHTFQNYGVFSVILSATENGCSDSATLTIVVIINEITYQIPNVFTPNTGDDINSYFYLIDPLGFNRVEEFEIIILNRWGQVIKTYTNYDFAWNGKDESGNDVPEGVYFYKMYFRTVQDDVFENHGFLQLVRE